MIVLLIFIQSASLFAQIVDIPDPYFKQKLLNHNPVIDTNGDNEIQLSEALAFTGTLEVAFTAGDPEPITNLIGLEAFANIVGLSVGYNAISEIDLSGNQALVTYNGSGNLYTSLDFSYNPNLELVQSNNGNLNAINLQNNPNLVWVHLQGNELSSINLGNNPLIQGLNLDFNPMNQIDLTSNPMLRFLNCRGLELETLDVSNNGILLAVDCQDNPNLTYINLKNGNNEGLNLSGTGPSCEFYDLPNLASVCLDEIDSALSNLIVEQVGHSVTFMEECILNQDSFNLDSVKIYPNPTKDILNIESLNVITEVNIVNLLGEIVYNNPIHKSDVEINVQALPTGLYLILLTVDKGSEHILKLIKE